MKKKYLEILEQNSDLLNLFGLKVSNLGNTAYLTRDNVSTLYNLNVRELGYRTVLNSISDKTTLTIEVGSSDLKNIFYISLSDFYNTMNILKDNDTISIELISNAENTRAIVSISKSIFEYKYKDQKREIYFSYNENISDEYANLVSYACKNVEEKTSNDEVVQENFVYKIFVKYGRLFVSNNGSITELPYILKDKYIHDYLVNRYMKEELYFVLNHLTTNCPNIIPFFDKYSVFKKVNASKLNLNVRQKLYLALHNSHLEHKGIIKSKVLTR